MNSSATGSGIGGVLFDKDGTLFDFNETWADWTTQVLHDLAPNSADLRMRLGHAGGFDVATRQFQAESLLVSATSDEMAEVWAGLLDHVSFEEINAICLDRLIGLVPKPVQDLHSALGRLRAMGLTLGVATNDFVASAEEQLSTAGVLQEFKFVCGFDSGFGGKPAPGMIEAFSSHCSIPLRSIAMVGDSLHDIDAGRAAGVGLAVGVLTGPATQEELASRADIVLDGVRSLPDYLAEKNLHVEQHAH